MQHAVIVHSHDYSISPGTILIGDTTIRKREREGFIVLPAEEKLLQAQREVFAASHFIGSYGEQGSLLVGMSPTRCCPVVLALDESTPWIHWVMSVTVCGPGPMGSFGLVAHPLLGMPACSVSEHKPLRVSPKFPKDRDIQVIFGGVARATGSGLSQFMIHAVAQDVAIHWCAVSQCEAPHELSWMDEAGSELR